MKTEIMKKQSIHIIPLILLTMLFACSACTYATTVKQDKSSYKKPTNVITLAKGQPYVPPQQLRVC